jgi:glycosyltransferase involved in cell wall biosynthesis
LVAIEAAAHELPIVATPVNGIVDFVVHSESGVLLKPDPRLIALELKKICYDEYDLKKMGISARLRIGKFSYENSVRQYNEFFKN